MILDNTNLGAGKGITVYRTFGNVFLIIIFNGGGTAIVLAKAGAITDTNWHSVKIKIADGTNNTSMQIDGNDPVTGTLGTTGIGDASFDMRIGLRQNDTLGANCRISDLVILDQIITEEDEAHWDSWNPILPTLTLQPDDNTANDVYLVQSNPTFNFDDGFVAFGWQASPAGQFRGLMMFDVSSLTGNTVEDATLTISVFDSVGANDTFSVYRVTRVWDEDWVTWNWYANISSWDNPGGDFDEETVWDSILINSSVDAVFDLGAMVQDAIDNQGGILNLLIKGTKTSGGDNYWIGKSSFSVPAPKLVVNYTVPSPLGIEREWFWRHQDWRRWHTEKYYFRSWFFPSNFRR